MIKTRDIFKIFFPSLWFLICMGGSIIYLVIPKCDSISDTIDGGCNMDCCTLEQVNNNETRVRVTSSFAWLFSGIISLLLTINLWKFHREDSYLLYENLPEKNQKWVKTKILISILLFAISVILSFIFWFSNHADNYADACAYTVSSFLSVIWVLDLIINHKNKIENI